MTEVLELDANVSVVFTGLSHVGGDVVALIGPKDPGRHLYPIAGVWYGNNLVVIFSPVVILPLRTGVHDGKAERV